MIIQIGCIVEGHAEVEAVPVLIRRVAAYLFPELVIVIPRPTRVPKSKILEDDELEKWVEVASISIDGQGGLFIILDSDGDCPAELGPTLLQRASKARQNLPIAVVVANQEFEAWFLAAAESLRGRRGLKKDIRSPDNPETIRDAKGWLSQRMQSGETYHETRDQPALTALFDIEQARQADSFDKCYRDIVRLLGELRKVNEATRENV